MTDRYAGYVVTLDEDIRNDDAEKTITALRQLKGVINVEPVINTPEIHIAEARARTAIYNKLADVVWNT